MTQVKVARDGKLVTCLDPRLKLHKCKLISHAFDSCDLRLSALDASSLGQCCGRISAQWYSARVSARIMSKIKKKRTILSVEIKLKIIKELNAGALRKVISRDFGVPESTISDIYRDREKIIKSTQNRSGPSIVKGEVEKDILNWFSQQTSNKLPVLGIELEIAAKDIASQKKAVRYNVNKDWLQEFCRKNDIVLCKVSPCLKKTKTTNGDEFRKELLETMKKLGISEKDVYVAKGFGLLWRNLSGSIIGFKDSKGFKKFKEDRFVTMLCANADGSHKLNLLVVGNCRITTTRSAKSYTETDGPLRRVHRRSQKTAWVTRANFLDWFENIFVPGVADFQNVAKDDVKAILVMDDGPSIPETEELSSVSKGIICLKLPSAASTVLPLSQGIFESCKRAYKLKLVDAILIDDNLSHYTIDIAFSNWASSWEEVEQGDVSNAWSKLLGREGPDINEGLSENAFQSVLREKLKSEVSEEDILEWLTAEMEMPIYQFLHKPTKPTQTTMDMYVLSSKNVPSTSHQK